MSAAAADNRLAAVEPYDVVMAVKLTELVTSGGCAAKYPAAQLQALLAGFVPAAAEDLLVGLSPADDAAVYRLNDDTALVFTLDFFPPLVDDPRDFGTIAATNALNDVYAMGGRPLLALSIAEFPEELPQETVAAILDAAGAQVRAAGAILAGGHTIRDREPKYGLAVVGTVHPDGVWSKSGARPGDAVFLTKPLGTGLVLHGAARRLVGEQEVGTAVGWMTRLNLDWAEVLRPFRPNAVTDVTGFGLLGHAYETAERSGARLVFESVSWPVLDGALEVARAGERTGGDRRNRDFAAAHVAADGIADELLTLGWDPQTAGGLLISLPADKGSALVAELTARDLFVRRIGRVEEGAGVAVI
jgi:selenide, water dikinase